jgi:hypothetical protein
LGLAAFAKSRGPSSTDERFAGAAGVGGSDRAAGTIAVLLRVAVDDNDDDGGGGGGA